MNLKNLVIFITLIPFCGCDERKINQELVKNLWQETLNITGLDAQTPMPELVFTKEDFYGKLVNLNCQKYSVDGWFWNRCINKKEKLEAKAKAEIGPEIYGIYKVYIEIEQRLMNENCRDYEKEEQKQCKKDQERLNDSGRKVMARAFLLHNRIEIYLPEIESHTPISFNHKEDEVYFYSIVAHEFLHISYYLKNVPAINHHVTMLEEKHLENLIDFLGLQLELKTASDPKERALNNLRYGIENDAARNRSRKRLDQPPHNEFQKEGNEPLFIECFFEIN